MGATDQLVDRAKRGDAGAYEQVFERLATRLLAYIELRLGPGLRAHVEPLDVLQEAYLEAHRAFARFDPRGRDAFLRWMYRIIDHRILDQADRFGAQKRSTARLEGGPSVLERLRASLTGPSTRAAREEERRSLAEAMDRLEERQRHLLLLHHFQGRTAEEIALSLGQTARHVRRLLRDAEQRLGAEIERARAEVLGVQHAASPTEQQVQLGVKTLVGWARARLEPEAGMPSQVGPYRISAELGRGAIGVVYRARDPITDEEVALKLLRGQDPDARRRFLREARALTTLSHPGIVCVRDAGEHAGAPYLVMDLVAGTDLQRRLDERGPLPVPDALEVAIGLARALQHAHERGVLHRDVKPNNVVCRPDGTCVLTDFSLAKLLGVELSQLSERGQQLGTEGYWPPEQARGQLSAIGPASDVYGVGATLYAMLTGRAPFTGPNQVARLRATLRDPPPMPSTTRPEVSAAVDAVCARCLAKKPTERFESARALAEALEEALRTWRSQTT